MILVNQVAATAPSSVSQVWSTTMDKVFGWPPENVAALFALDVSSARKARGERYDSVVAGRGERRAGRAVKEVKLEEWASEGRGMGRRRR
jgi:hypothetical protein